MARLGSLLEFLSSPHAAHLRCLQLGEDGRQLCQFPDFHKGDKAFAMALLGACLSACAGLAFEELHVFTIIQQPSLGFLASFTSLRRLRIEVPNDVELPNGGWASSLPSLLPPCSLPTFRTLL